MDGSLAAFFMFAWFVLATSLLFSRIVGPDRLPAIVRFGPAFYALGSGRGRALWVGAAWAGAVVSQLIVVMIISGSSFGDALILYVELLLAVAWLLYLAVTTRA
jgi:hypothetical protein